MSDLSDYERLRLENIRRNAAFLASLGLSDTVAARKESKRERQTSADGRSPAKKKRQFCHPKQEEVATRRSLRLLQQSPHESTSNAPSVESVDDRTIDYDAMPSDSEQLDDHEFEVFVHLKAWRYAKSKDLGIEPYKICQNRALCELIRRKRNDEQWASLKKNKVEIENDLLQCWGIGPSKARPEHFGWELNEQIEETEDLLKLLRESRTSILAGN